MLKIKYCHCFDTFQKNKSPNMSATVSNNVAEIEPANPTQTNTGEDTDSLLKKDVQQSDPANSLPKKKPQPKDEPGSTSPKKDSAEGSTPRSPRERVQRQFSKDKDSVHKRIRTVSAMSGSGSISGRGRSDSVSSYSRRPSLSFGHADSLPMFLDKPTPEQIGTDEGKRVLYFACVVDCVVVGLYIRTLSVLWFM